MTSMQTHEVLALLQSVAAEVITPRFRALADHQIDEKRPGDLVTVADRESEELITAALVEAYPDAVILGEEASHDDAGLVDRFRAADHGFTVDPIDGTKNFVAGSPDHAVMVAEMLAGETVRGWIWQPEHETSWVAERGSGVRRNGELFTREPAAGAPQGATSMWSRRGREPIDLPPLRGTWLCCGVDYPQLLEGACDFLLYGHTHLWDHLPGTLMVAEAGGASAHADGSSYGPRSAGSGLVVASDAETLRRATEASAGLWPRRR